MEGGYVWCSHSLAVGLSEAAMGGLVREIASALLSLCVDRKKCCSVVAADVCCTCKLSAFSFLFIEWTSVGRNVNPDWGQLIGSVWGKAGDFHGGSVIFLRFYRFNCSQLRKK